MENLKRNWPLSSTDTPITFCQLSSLPVPNIAIEAGMVFLTLFHIEWPCKDHNFQMCLRDNLVPRMLEMAFQSLQI